MAGKQATKNNLPGHSAIDFISGEQYQFRGDSILLQDGMLQNFHLKPGRIFFQLNKMADSIPGLYCSNMFYQFGNKKIFLISTPVSFSPVINKIDVDIIIISKNPRMDMDAIAKIFNCKLLVFDASNPAWKIKKWVQQCKKLNLQTRSIPEKGALLFDVDT